MRQFWCFWDPQFTPRAVAKVGNPRRLVHSSIGKRMSSFESMIVMFKDDIHAILVEQRAPILSLLFARTKLVSLAFRGAVRWITRNMVDGDEVWLTYTLFESFFQPGGLLPPNLTQ